MVNADSFNILLIAPLNPLRRSMESWEGTRAKIRTGLQKFEVAKTDAPYVFRSRFLGANGIYLYTRNLSQRFNGPWERPKIEFSDQVRQVGEELGPIADQWCLDLFHAFGLDAPV